MLTVAGDQVPVIPLVDVVDKTGTVPPWQVVRDVPKEKTGVTFEFTVTLKTVVVAHCPAEGEKV